MKKIFLSFSIFIISIAFVSAQETIFANEYCKYTNINTNMFMGGKNKRSEVLTYQNFLQNYYPQISLKLTTGYFGPATKNFTIMFQKENGLRPTGGVGPLTRAKIKEKCAGQDDIFCPAIYQPVCGEVTSLYECCGSGVNKPAYCLYAKVACEQKTTKTFSNSCELGKAKAKKLYDGECGTVTQNEPPTNCKVWYDGCNTCSRQTPGAPLACTMMACFQNAGAVCREYF